MAVSGVRTNEPHGSIDIQYFNANGTLDTTFAGGTGYALATVSGPSDDRANAMAVQTDGAILVGGSANGLFALMRFTAEGAVDTTFGANGRAPTPIGTTTMPGLSIPAAPSCSSISSRIVA